MFDYELVVLFIVCFEAKADRTFPQLGSGVWQHDALSGPGFVSSMLFLLRFKLFAMCLSLYNSIFLTF